MSAMSDLGDHLSCGEGLGSGHSRLMQSNKELCQQSVSIEDNFLTSITFQRVSHTYDFGTLGNKNQTAPKSWHTYSPTHYTKAH
jgi:hypothetical protein